MESTIKYAKDLIKHGKINQISDTLFEVDGYSTKIKKSDGRCLFLCNCSNSSIFADNNLCSHKIAAIIYLANRDFLDRLKKLTEQYTGYKNHKLNPSVDCFIDDLNSIKEKW